MKKQTRKFFITSHYSKKQIHWLLALLCLLAVDIKAQEISWVRGYGDHTSDFSVNSIYDNEGNILLSGYATKGTIFGNHTIESWGIFVTKLNSAGESLWTYESDGSWSSMACGLACDSNNDIIITGSYQGGMKFDTIQLPPATQPKIFVAKLDGESGELVRVKSFVSSHVTSTIRATGIAIDEEDNTYVTGSFNRDLIFGSDTLFSNIDNVYNRYDVFILKLNPDGDPVWAKRAGGTYEDYAYDIIFSNNNLYITGNFHPNEADFDTLYFDSEIGGTRGFIANYDKNGNCKWLVHNKRIENSTSESINLTTDYKGNIYASGIYYRMFGFESDTLYAPGLDYYHYCYLLKLDSLGNKISMNTTFKASSPSSSMEGSWRRKTCELTTDSNGSVYVVGDFRDTLVFRNDTLISYLTQYEWHSPDIIVAKYNEIGYPQWAKKAGGPSFDYTFGVTSVNDTVIINGFYCSEEGIFGDTTIINNSGNMDEDIFIANIIDTTAVDCPPINAELVAEKLFTCGEDSIMITCNAGYGSRYFWIINDYDTVRSYSKKFWVSDSCSIKAIVNPGTICTDTSNTLIIINKEYPVVDLTANPSDILCAGDSVELHSNYYDEYVYYWYREQQPMDTGINYQYVLDGGSYSVNVDYNGCQKIDSILITKKDAPLLSIETDTLLLYFYPYNFNAGWSNDYYRWTYGSDSTVISYDSIVQINYQGTYYVNLSNECGYQNDSIYAYSYFDSVDETSFEYFIYPNPSNGTVIINNDHNITLSIKVYDIKGVIIFETNTSNRIINIEDIPVGEYIIRIESQKGTTTKKLIIKN